MLNNIWRLYKTIFTKKMQLEQFNRSQRSPRKYFTKGNFTRLLKNNNNRDKRPN